MRKGELARVARTAMVLGVLGVASCDLDVQNPGRVQDDDLDNPASVGTVLIGLISDVEVAVDEMVVDVALASGEMVFSGTRSWYDFFSNGVLNPADANVIWDPAAVASKTTMHGVERIAGLVEDPESDPSLAQAHMWAGFIQRAKGDVFCEAVLDGGPAEPNEVYYERAIDHFTRAREIAAAASGALADSIRVASAAGLAQAHLILGNHGEAVGFAAEVPNEFVRFAHRSGNSGREENLMWFETTSGTNRQLTVFATEFADAADPRTPWEDAEVLGNGGTVQFYRQLKYNDRGSDIAIAKGTEMRLIEAEVALRNGDVAEAMAKINEVRAGVGLPQESASDAEEAWQHLIDERAFDLWLEGRRLKDRARFQAEGRDSFIEGRGACFPFSLNEINSNPNLRGG